MMIATASGWLIYWKVWHSTDRGFAHTTVVGLRPWTPRTIARTMWTRLKLLGDWISGPVPLMLTMATDKIN